MSSETTIRDVVIKVNFEQATSTLSMSAFDTVQTQADSAQKAIVEVTKAIQQFQTTAASATASNVSTATLTGLTPLTAGLRFPDSSRISTNVPAHGSVPALNPVSLQKSIGLSSSQANSGLTQLADATKQLNTLKSAALGAAEAKQTLGNATGGLNPQLLKLATIVQSGATAVENATMAIGGMAQAAMAAGQRYSALVTVVKAGLNLYSEALKQTRDENRDYWREIADDAQTAVAQQQRAISQRVEHGQRRLEAQSFDTSESQVAHRHIKAQAERESRIRDEQARIADRPLAERQERRHRIERKGAHQDQREAIQAKIDHLEQHKSRIGAEKKRLQGEFDKADQLHKGLEKPREQSRVRASGLGVASKTAVAAFGLSETWIPERVINAVGGTTTLEEKEDSFLRRHAERRAAADAANTRRSVANGIVSLSQDELNTDQQISALKQQKHAVTVREQREARMIAEQGAESLTEKMLKFGSADEGTKASLREIQHKADQGAELNHLEKQLAESYGIGASQQARKQSVDSAMSPENAHLFAHDVELQNQREQEANAAESQPVQEEQDELTNQIGKMSDEMKLGTSRLITALEEAFKVDSLIDSISTQIEAQAAELQRLQVRINRNWFY